MHKNNKKGFIGLLFNPIVLLMIVVVVLLLVFGLPDFSKLKLSILPELDNRINYYDKKEDMPQFVQISSTEFENEKFYYSKGGNSDFVVSDDSISLSCGTGGNVHIVSKKDLSRLKSYVKYRTYEGGYFAIGDDYIEVAMPLIGSGSWDNIEIIPDNLNIGIYNIFYNGQFYKKVELKGIKFLASCNNNRQNIEIDYIKFVPDSTYSIRNDEVWVKEVRGSDYSYNDLNWEMIGFQSEIRPATIRDLTAQTEKPAPQIYINLINNLPITVEPNTIHTFYYRTKWVSGLDSSCQGQLDKVEVKGSDGSWHCESYVKETPIIQQCQTKADCPILPECEAQKDLISCNNNLCDFTAFSPACKNQLITYQEIVTEKFLENTKFVPIISGTNSFYCFFDKTSSSCNVGEKIISMSSPIYACVMPSDSSTIVSTSTNTECWKSSLSFLGQSYEIANNQIINNIGSNIKAEISMSAALDSTGKLRDTWGIAGKFTLPDNFLEIKPKSLGNKFILQNSNEPITFTITNNLGFGIDGGYSLLTTNTALEGGVVLRDETQELFLKSGSNDITYNFKTGQLGTIVDIIGVFGKVKTDKDYIMKSSINGKEKFLVITKEVKTEIPSELEKVQPIIQERKVPTTKPNFIAEFFNKLIAWIKNLFN